MMAYGELGTFGTNRAVEFAGKAITGVLVASTPFFAWLGYQQGADNEREANAAASDQAATLEVCVDYSEEHTGQRLVFSAVPTEVKNACGIPPVISLGSTAVEVNPDDVFVRLPPTDQLQQEIESLRADARDFNQRVPLTHAAIAGAASLALGVIIYFEQNV